MALWRGRYTAPKTVTKHTSRGLEFWSNSKSSGDNTSVWQAHDRKLERKVHALGEPPRLHKYTRGSLSGNTARSAEHHILRRSFNTALSGSNVQGNMMDGMEPEVLIVDELNSSLLCTNKLSHAFTLLTLLLRLTLLLLLTLPLFSTLLLRLSLSLTLTLILTPTLISTLPYTSTLPHTGFYSYSHS